MDTISGVLLECNYTGEMVGQILLRKGQFQRENLIEL